MLKLTLTDVRGGFVEIAQGTSTAQAVELVRALVLWQHGVEASGGTPTLALLELHQQLEGDSITINKWRLR